mgnify:CR=1 FL=1
MNMIFVLARRDFMSRVKSGPYIITTILGMLVFIGLSFAPLLLDYFEAAFDEQPLDFLVVDYSGEFYPFLAEVLSENEPDGFVEEVPPGEENAAFQRVIDEEKLGLLLVDMPEFAFVALDGANYVNISRVENIVNQSLTRLNAQKIGLSPEQLNALFGRIELQVREIGSQDGESERDFTTAAVLAYFMIFMIYMTLILYGNMVASGVAEEKSSRIMEVMIAKVKPMELMFGKILGVGALGLMQFGIWIGTVLTVTALRNASGWGPAAGGLALLSGIHPSVLVWFVLFFVLGFFFYASIFAAGGAVVSRVEDVNQISTLIMMLIMVGFFAAFISFANPNGRLAVITSLVPFTSPMVMFARLILADPPVAQVAVSLALLVAGVIGGAWFSGKVYRIGVLLYGKRPTIREIVRYMRG